MDYSGNKVPQMPHGKNAPRRLVILGATGSIGRSTQAVLAESSGFVVEAVAAGRDGAALARAAIAMGARFAAVADAASYNELKAGLSGTGIEAAAGAQAVVEAATRPSDLVMAGIAGTAGVVPTHAAIVAGRNVALANKECLVCAGDVFMRAVQASGARLLPVDSEHNAIFQALGGASPADVEKMYLTASGGPFRLWSAEKMAAAAPKDALAHPNWAMGPKVSIDSATLMNKGLELIEAHHLFGVEAARLDVLVHPQSIVHGLVSFADGSVTACLAAPDMRTPIAHCLGYPQRLQVSTPRLDLAALATLTFEKPDLGRFPALRLAIAALQAGGIMPTVLNAANEVAVEAFLAHRIGFADIATIVESVCNATLAERSTNKTPHDIAEALGVDHVARERARSCLRPLGG